MPGAPYNKSCPSPRSISPHDCRRHRRCSCIHPRLDQRTVHSHPFTRGEADETSPQRVLPASQILFCCGRSSLREKSRFRSSVQRIEDAHHPRGYREIRSAEEMRKLLKRKIVEQNFFCGICGELFLDSDDIVPDHILPRGMGAARRDDHPDNIQAAHRRCNREKGSRRGRRI